MFLDLLLAPLILMIIIVIIVNVRKLERRKKKYYLFYHIVFREKPSIQKELNQQSLDHEACAQPLCYNRCPISAEVVSNVVYIS